MSSSIDRTSEPDQVMMPDEPIPDGNGAVILRPGEDLRTQCELCPIKALRALATVHGLTDIKSIEGDQVPTRRTRLISAILLRITGFCVI